MNSNSPVIVVVEDERSTAADIAEELVGRFPLATVEIVKTEREFIERLQRFAISGGCICVLWG